MSGIVAFRGWGLIRSGALVVAGLGLAASSAHATARGDYGSYYGNPSPRAARVTDALDTCHSGTTAADRYATFSGQMTTVPHADSMAMRFTLMARLPGDPVPKHLSAPGLDVWQRSVSHVGIFRYRQEVSNLPAGSSVRAWVAYRWLDPNGKVIRHVNRRSSVCQVPDLRPNLVVETITHTLSANPRSDTYTVDVRNVGVGAASSFNVLVTVDGNSLPTQTVDSLAPEQLRILTFTGPRCTPGQPLSATADPDNRVDETTKADNVKTVAC
ncbi:MAG TPA: CARDB domain-containing protein [Solirubrobacteraceae bacterium]|nr:CARDB domain-containing protein [Solirubrobacteraceae bacterium]